LALAACSPAQSPTPAPDATPAVTAVQPPLDRTPSPTASAPVQAAPSPTATPESDAADAVAVVQAYYDAINHRAYDRAFALWANAGAASNQTFRQFAHGFEDTRLVDVAIGAPSEIDAAAGQRYIEIPAQVTATHVDGTVHRYAGRYTLHRAVVDGATPDQRAWRIGSATLRETATQSSKR